MGFLVFFASAAFASPPNDTIVIGQAVDAATLDPAEISSRDASNIAEHIFGTLFDLGENGEMTPYLADAYTVSDDGKVITYRMHPRLTCEDGEPLTARSAAYSFNRAADPENRFTGNTAAFVFTSVGFVKAVAADDLTLQIVMNKYSPIAPQMLTEVFIHCQKSYEKMSLEQAARAPVGSGPYRMVEWVRDDHITLERVPGFTLRPALPKRIVWRVIPEALTRAAELIAGNVDIITNVVPDQLATIDASPSARVQVVNGTRRMFIGFNLKDKFSDTPGGKALQKPEVRRALQYAVDVPTICDTLLKTPCVRATGPVNPPNDDKSLTPYPYDPDKAEKLLDAAGYPRGKDGIRFSLTLQSPNGRYLADSSVSQAIGQYLTDIGVDTKVELLDWASVFTPAMRRHDTGPLFFLGTGGAAWSALYDLSVFATPDAGTNYSEWKDPEFYAEWAGILAAKDPAEQRRHVETMLKIFYERPPWLMLYFQPDFYGVNSRVAWKARRDERVLVGNVTIH
jgi:peptide/nickel transport system substrate-binding protein